MHPFALDPIVIPFLDELIKGNYLTAGLVIVILKYIAVRTKWAGDDKILSFLLGLGSVIKNQLSGKPAPPPPPVETENPS